MSQGVCTAQLSSPEAAVPCAHRPYPSDPSDAEWAALGPPPPEPSAAIIDSQTARTTGVGGPARGYDPAKRVAGRKRHVLVDASGLVLLAHVADLHDRLGAQALVARAAAGELPRLELVWGDGAYAGTFARWLQAERGWRVEVPKHRKRRLWRHGLEEKPKGFYRRAYEATFVTQG